MSICCPCFPGVECVLKAVSAVTWCCGYCAAGNACTHWEVPWGKMGELLTPSPMHSPLKVTLESWRLYYLVSLGVLAVHALWAVDGHMVTVQLAGTRAACHMHIPPWCTFASMLCLSHLASIASPLLPFLFRVVFPLSRCRAFCLLSCPCI